LIAARMTGPSGKVVGTDMTPQMLDRAREAASEAGFKNVEFHQGHAESLPLPDGWADVVISNGVVNLCPDKPAVFREMFRVLKPGGRLQIGDIMVQKAVPQSAKDKIELWTG
jgi:ubiquinone/menaquinone biosynthesis C-methylase UbiE